MDTIIYYSEMDGIFLEHLKRSSGYDTVSYTHLTLPTSDLV